MKQPPRPAGILRPHPLVALIAFAKIGLLLNCASAYGYHKDELPLLAYAQRLEWGYVGHPPLALGILAFASRLYGETILSVRLVPALAGAMAIVLTARLARKLGAGTWGQTLAALSVALSPELLAESHTFTAAALTPMLWVAISGLLVRAVTDEDESSVLPWLRVGIMMGLACLNDLPSFAFVLAVVVALALSPDRRWLALRGPWVAAVALLAFLFPYLSWERAHAWPTLEVLGNEWRAGAPGSVLGFLRGQLTWMLPTNAIVWGAGLWSLFRGRYRVLGVTWALLFVGFGATGRLPASVLAPAYPVLFAAGAAFLEKQAADPSRRWVLPTVAAAIAVPGAMAAPLAIPLFRVTKYEEYAASLHLSRDVDAPLPPRFADMYGWPELARAVAIAVESLPPEDRERVAVLASNEAEAGALMLFGDALGLPPVVCGENEFWLRGTLGVTGQVVIAVGDGTPRPDDADELKRSWKSVETLTVFGHSLASPREQRVKLHLCRDVVAPLPELWDRFRTYD